ncbi:nucleoporin protein Ndc1-Nup [Choanephora cucurbitarum]|nr:nucleoporin protein Ndc1-Nup [Choanephora cucurbitarum]
MNFPPPSAPMATTAAPNITTIPPLPPAVATHTPAKEPEVAPAQQSITRKHYNSYSEIHLFFLSHFGLRFFQLFMLFVIGFTVLFQSHVIFSSNGFYGLFSLTSITFSSLLLLTGFTFFIIRNLTYTIWEPTYPSLLAEWVASWTSLDNMLLLGAHSLFSWILVRFYFGYIAKENYTSSMLVTPLGHYLGARQLNQENIFISYYIGALAFFYTYKYISQRVYVIKLNAIQQPILEEVKTSLATLICQSCMTALRTLLFVYVSYILFNATIYHTVARFFGLFYSLLDSPVIGFNWTDLRLLLRTALAGSLTTITFDFTHRLYNIAFSRVTPSTDVCSNQFDILIDGMTNERERCRIFAFSELASLTSKRAEKRQELYRTVGKEVKDTAWFRIMEVCLKQLDQLKTKIDIEYNGVPKAQPVQTTTTATTTTAVKPLNHHRLQFEEGQDIYARQVKKTAELDDRTSHIFCDLTERYEVPLSTATEEYSNELNRYLKYITQNSLVDFIKTIELKAGHAGALKAVYADTTTRRTHLVFREYQLSLWAIQILASLVSCSLNEDPYGYVQNHMSDVLNALLDLLCLVEKYETSPPLGHARLFQDKVKVHEPHAVGLALKEGIYQIRVTFDQYLNCFEVKREYGQKWQRFIDFQE